MSRRCWGEKPPAAVGFVARREPRLDPGTTLFRQGEHLHAIYIVMSGCLILRETGLQGASRAIGFLLPGEIVGLENWVGGRHSHTAEAATATTGLSIEPAARRPRRGE